MRAVRENPDAFGDDSQTVLHYPEEYWVSGIQRGQVFVIDDGTDLIAMAVFLPVHAGTWTVKSVWVDPAYRKKGLGRKIMKQIISLAPSLSVSEIRLDVNRANEIAVNMYTELGFERTGEYEKTLGDGMPHRMLAMKINL